MIRLLIPAILLSLVSAGAVAQTKSAKPAAKPTAKAAAKPAVKPVAKPAIKPKPRPTLSKPRLDRAEIDGFGVLQVAAPDAAKFITAWKIGDGAKAASTQTIANQPLFTLLIFRGCKPDPLGKCDIVADFVIHRPDGTINEENKGVVIWNKAAPADPKQPYIGDGALGYGTDEEGPFGDYRIVATVTDRVAGVSVTTEQTLSIAPALKSGAIDVAPEKADPAGAAPAETTRPKSGPTDPDAPK